MKHYDDMLDISNNKAKAVLYSLARKFNGKPRIETYWHKRITGNFICTFMLAINNDIVNCNGELRSIAVCFDEDKLSFYKKNKYRFLLSTIVSLSLQGNDIFLGNPTARNIFVKHKTPLEQLLIETELVA